MTNASVRPGRGLASGAMLDASVVSGPQGPRVVLDGKTVLLLCSENYLGLAEHPRLREAAADAAMRWGAGAGGPFAMTVHRRLEAALAALVRVPEASLFATVEQALAAALPAQAPVWHDGTRPVAGATRFRRGDAEHLAWLASGSGARGGTVVVESVAAADGGVAPVAELVDVARTHGLRLVVDESHALGCIGPGGAGIVAECGAADVATVVGSLGTALGAFGAFASGVEPPAAPATTALPPPAAAAALAAVELLEEQPRRIDKLRANATALRDALTLECFDVTGSETQIVPLHAGDAATARRIRELARAEGVLAGAGGGAVLRVTVTAAHAKSELRDAAKVLARAALRAGDGVSLRAA